jgi:hypothetical protein
VRLPSSKPPPDSRQHHRHHRAQARRGDRRRRAPRVREDRGECAALLRARGDLRGDRAGDGGSFCAINLFDQERQVLSFRRGAEPAARVRRPPWTGADRHPLRLVRRRRVSCAADHRGRHRDRCALGVSPRGGAARGLRAAWSAPIVASDGQVVGTFAVYRATRACRWPATMNSCRAWRRSPGSRSSGAAPRMRCATASRNSAACSRASWKGCIKPRATAAFWWPIPHSCKCLGYELGRGGVPGAGGACTGIPSDRETFVRRIESEGEVRNEEYVLRRKDGSMLVVVDNGRVVRDKQGRLTASRARSPTSPSARRRKPRCSRPRSARRSRCSRSAMR